MPGPGLDDAPAVRVEIFEPADTPYPDATYAFLRDELGTVVGVVEDGSSPDPGLLVRYLYTPYGEAHAEAGPELRRLLFDNDRTTVDTYEQTIADPATHAAGALLLGLSLPADPATIAAGIVLTDDTAGTVLAQGTDYVAVPIPDQPETVALLPLEGWVRGHSYRVTLTAGLADTAGRPLAQPRDLALVIPAEGAVTAAAPPDLAVTYDSVAAAASDLGGRFPGGQTMLFQGLWTDPTTGLAYASNRWYDPHNAAGSAEDPAGAVDSSNLYAFVGWGPNAGTDPMGLAGPGDFFRLRHAVEVAAETAAPAMAGADAAMETVGHGAPVVCGLAITTAVCPPVGIGLGLGLLAKGGIDQGAAYYDEQTTRDPHYDRVYESVGVGLGKASGMAIPVQLATGESVDTGQPLTSTEKAQLFGQGAGIVVLAAAGTATYGITRATLPEIRVAVPQSTPALPDGPPGPGRAAPSIPGDSDFIGPIRGRTAGRPWTLVAEGEGAHLIERGNLRGRSNLSLFDEPGTPRYYPSPEDFPANAGAAHLRIHDATRAAGMRVRGTPELTDLQLLLRYRAAYNDPTLQGIRGTLRTPDGSTVIGQDLTPAEAYRALLRWAIQRGGS